ncbi:DNA topoisomerase IV [Flavobacterium album]|uniref:DNA topoisomerase IV n=1 Tax=Flavobacterium album TaxID=2175091 RepID=A0A2S1R047_9FLAO|nr:DNA topoisomerase IV [Flavobacterium album]AWH86038.1 DNA topoisomerase IV [Flavobacterium album]
MKNYITLLSLSFLFIGCYQQERNCKDFKTGKFRAEYEIDGKKQASTFERTENLEIENFGGKTDSASIRWVNDCEYVMQKINPKNMQEKKAVSIKILTTNANSYTFEFSLVGDTKKQKGTVTKID